MTALHKFLSLTRRDKLLLFEVVMLLFGTRIALRLLPFQTVRRILVRLSTPKHSITSAGRRSAVESIVRLTSAAGRRVPAVGTCLAQALTAYVLLGRRGCSTKLRIGVNKDGGGKFVAHAWLEADGRILIGQLGPNQDGYIPLPALNGLEP